jgi:hypothetical protein
MQQLFYLFALTFLSLAQLHAEGESLILGPCQESLTSFEYKDRQVEVALRKGEFPYLAKLGAREVPLDTGSEKDLEFDLLARSYGRHALSNLGYMRIQHMLRHSLVDPELIAQRQSAIEEIASNPELLRSLQEFIPHYKELLSGENGALFDRSPLFNEISPLGEGLKQHRITGGVVGGITAILGALDPTFSLGGLYVWAMSSDTAKKLRAKRFEIAKYQGLLSNLRSFTLALKGSRSPMIKNLAGILEEHVQPKSPIGRATETPLSTSKWSVLPDFLYLSGSKVLGSGQRIQESYKSVLVVLCVLTELDALQSVASLWSSARAAYTLPQVLPQENAALRIEEGHLPYQFALTPSSVPNPAHLEFGEFAKSPQFVLLTGPNYRGKSHYLKMVGHLTLAAQAGFPVPARSMQWTPMRVLTSMRAQDSSASSESFFYAQARRIAEIDALRKTFPRSLVLMDEILTGTSPEEHQDAESAMIDYVIESPQTLGMLATHDRSRADLFYTYRDRMKLLHMSDSDEPSRIFRIEEGISRRRNALAVMEKAGVPSSILEKVRRLQQQRLADDHP